MSMLSEATLESLPSTEAPPVSSFRGFAGARRFIGSAVLLALALACTIALCIWSGVSLGDSITTLVSAPLWLLAATTALTVAQIALSAWKWQLVLLKLRPNDAMPFGFLYNCTALAAFLSQFLTVYVASVVVRGWALKRSYGLTVQYGATTSLFEQSFDLMVLVIMVVPTLLIWVLDGTYDQWMLATAAVIVGGTLLLPFFSLAGRCAELLGGHGTRMQVLSTAMMQCAASGMLALPFVFKFYAISVARYFTMLVRIPLILIAFGLPIAHSDAVSGFTVVQGTQIAAITPGQLGIREWTWSGVLAVRGYNLEVATQFAIDLRLVGTVAMTLAALTCLAGVGRKAL